MKKILEDGEYMMKKNFSLEITYTGLHIMAMAFMLCDHLWGTVVPGNDWMTCIGRLAFPVFAFLLVEGYFHTKNLKRYLLRLLAFAVISEIPFNLAIGSRAFYPIHQNVLWTFLISLLLIHWNERANNKGNVFAQIVVGCASILSACIIGILTFVDYNHYGILTVLVFYFFRGRKWWCYLGQLVCLWYINIEMMGGLGYALSLFGKDFFLSQQSFALLALIPIWLYRGKQGHHSKPFQYFCYAFYPAHLLILGLLKKLVL